MKKIDLENAIETVLRKFGNKSYQNAVKEQNRIKRKINTYLTKRNEKTKQIKKYTIDDFLLP